MKIQPIYIEVAVKNIVILILFLAFLVPEISYEFEIVKEQQQGNVLSVLGFLMAGGIIGAFELSYLKTDLSSRLQRYLAHLAKFLIYLAVCILIWIGNKTMGISGEYYNDWILVASIMIIAALFIYDAWDIVSAVQQQFSGKAHL